MGFLHAILGGNGPALESMPVLAEGSPKSIVGESFYSPAFSKIARSLGQGSSTEAEVDVELRLDPKNPYSKSGKAIAVHVLNQKVGHVPEDNCAELYDLIIQRGRAARCKGLVFFDDLKSDRPHHSVTIFLDSPPRFPDQAALSVELSKLDDAKKDELAKKREDRIRGEGPDLPQLSPGDEVNHEDVHGFDLKILHKVLEPHGIVVGRSKAARLHIVARPDSWNSRVGLERLLKKDIPSVHLDEFFDKYPKFRPNKELEEAISAARTWMHANPSFDAVEKSIVEKASREGRLVLRGHAVVEGTPVDGGVSIFAYSPGRVMAEHRHNVKNLLVKSGARLYDKLLAVGDLHRDQEKNRYYVTVDGKDICAMYADDRNYFDYLDKQKRSKGKDLIEISWLDHNEFSVNVFSVHFLYI